MSKHTFKPGRWSELNGEKEVSDLRPGMDFRLPVYRREVFLRFYEYHLKYKAHPGCVYYIMPFLAEKFGWNEEQKLWYAFINGNTQNPLTSLKIMDNCPTPGDALRIKFKFWFESNADRLPFDTDRRYFRTKFIDSARCYNKLIGTGSQDEMFQKLLSAGSPERNFDRAWDFVSKKYDYFGRLSVFSYLEYLNVMGRELEPPGLFLEDIDGSKSHRNGLCKVLGRDDLDWHESNRLGFDGSYTPELMEWLNAEAKELLAEARRRMAQARYIGQVNNFTLESALCAYKSWYRLNRRYPNCYNDMLRERILKMESLWGPQPLFWEARSFLPRRMRVELNPKDCGLSPRKQNHFRNTGEVVMMDSEWSCFRNSFNTKIDGIN